jgi:hypothetical protein
VLKIFDKMVQDMPTADVVPKSEVAREILSDLKKKIHDRAVYPHNSHIDPYISLKAVDAIIEKEISHAKGGG